jgi:hypothetical protein
LRALAHAQGQCAARRSVAAGGTRPPPGVGDRTPGF